MQPYFFTALPGLWLVLKYQSLCYQLPNLFKKQYIFKSVLQRSRYGLRWTLIWVSIITQSAPSAHQR